MEIFLFARRGQRQREKSDYSLIDWCSFCHCTYSSSSPGFLFSDWIPPLLCFLFSLNNQASTKRKGRMEEPLLLLLLLLLPLFHSLFDFMHTVPRRSQQYILWQNSQLERVKNQAISHIFWEKVKFLQHLLSIYVEIFIALVFTYAIWDFRWGS